MPTGLRGLPGLNNLSEQERQAFMLNNADKLKAYARNPRLKKQAAEILYNNQQFINQFGQDEFDKLNNGTEEAYTLRNNLLRDKVVGDAFDAAYKPTKDNEGAGEEWDRISSLSTDSKEKLLNSGWKTPKELEKEENPGGWISKAGKVLNTIASPFNPVLTAAKQIPGVDKVAKALDPTEFVDEAVGQYRKESNKKILDRIYNDEADTAAAQPDKQQYISQAYLMPEITGQSDEDTKEKFREAVIPSKYNRGIPEYASHLDSSEMENFSIDDMRQVLAKKYVYDRTMSPDLAATALNNEAQRYIKDQQSGLKQFGLFAKDVGIAAMSYTADKINGIYNLGLAAADWLGDKPTVYVDDTGNVLDPNKTRIMQDRNGNLSYAGEDGTMHSVHKEQVDRRTLHNMGKEFDGSDAEEGMFHLNPQYWTRAEQFGTLDADEQKQWEKIGSSPYKVVYDPNDDRDLVYESFKMMSFGIADAASMLIPFGVGVGGRVLSTASNVGRVTRGLGKALETSGKYLSAQSKVGSLAQGMAGAGGIAYAYQRGSFQEILQQNLANAEEANLNKSKQEIYDLYNNDEQYKAQVDAMVDARANQMKQEYLAQARSEGQQIADENALDEMLRARASDAVHNELVAQRAQDNKGTQAYADLQQEAIQSAGDAAFTTFLPEAIKYGLVNTMGFRKFLYTNPQGLKKSVSNTLKGLKEVTTKEGRQRLATGASEFEGLGAQAKKLGKVAGSQFWGGAWTNGTDDMMVDAAERINEDSFSRYLKQYENGEALADEYGLIDGIYSYWRGLGNSMGQETTLDAATVGGFGSIVSASPNMANIVHLATKEGRDAYRDRFQKRLVYETDENGYKTIKKDENGKPVTEDIPLRENWLERAGFFIQNGVLNNYYGAKQNERELQQHADYVNGILDRYDDFNALKGLIASDIERQNAENLGDEKTMRFVHAFESINALEQLAKDKNDAVKFSSVVDDARSLIENASKIGTDENTLSEKQIAGLLSEYYAQNPGVGESDVNHEVALGHIAQNAKKMMEAYDAYKAADEHISNYEKDNQISIVPIVRSKMMLNKALSGHWRDRLNTMKEEIGDVSDHSMEPQGETLIATYGGIKNAKRKLAEYETGSPRETGEVALNGALNEARAEVSKKLDAYNEAQKEYRTADNSDARYQAEQKVQEARTEYENSLEQRGFIEDKLSTLQEKKKRLSDAIKEYEGKSKDEKEHKILTPDEIMALDPVSRARMMNPLEKMSYTAAQNTQINKLEERLKQQDQNGDPLQKIQDIATLTQRIAQADDAYNRLSRNPDAAALQMEKQTVQEAEKAYNLINERNAQTLANTVQGISDGLKVHKDVKQEDIDDIAYRMLRKHSPTLLDIMDKKGMLPDHQQQIQQAKEWSKVLNDIDAVVSQSNEVDEWKEEVNKNIDAVVSPANNKEEVISRLEQAIDNNHPQAAAFEKVLSDMTNLGYQREATVLEKRKERKEREEAARVKAEEDRKRAEEEAKKAAEDAAKKAEEAAKAMEEGKGSVSDAEQQRGIAEGQDVDLGLSEEPAGKAVGTANERQSKSFNIPISYTTQSGKTINTKYEVGTDKDGFTHITYNPLIDGTDVRNHSARRKITKKTLEDNGISYRDMFGESNKRGEDFDAENFEEAAIDKVSIAPDGTVAIDTEAGIIGSEKGTQETARKLLNIMFPEFSEAAIPSQQTEQEALDILVDWAEGRISGEDAIKRLDGTEYVKHTKGNKALGTTDGVHLSNAVERDLGKYVTEKYPFLHYGNVNETAGGMFQGVNLTVITDAEGNEYGTPSNFLRSLATNPNGRAAEVVKKGQTAMQQNPETSVINNVKKGHDDAIGDYVEGESPSVVEMAQQDTADNTEVSNGTTDVDAENDRVNRDDETNPATLSGNAMHEYNTEALKEHRLERQKGAKEDDNMNKYFAWMNAAGIKLQNIIDDELPKILAKNPHAKVKFACVKPERNATNDIDMVSHLLLVMDYDGNVKAAHKEENGGVIDNEGKKYLIVGVAGYGNNKDRRSLYNNVYGGGSFAELGMLQRNKVQYFKDHPAERFRVLDGVTTEVVPGSMVPGWIIKQNETDESGQHRKISELLADSERNPHKLTMNNLSWSIIEYTNIVDINTRGREVMHPQNQDANAGRVFVHIPAGNGKLLAAKIDALYLNDDKFNHESDLYQELQQLFTQLMAPQYKDRYDALLQLFQKLYINPEGHNILLSEDANGITFLRAGNKVRTVYTKAPGFTPQELYDAIQEWNPRINITPSILRNPAMLKKYDEAGALMTDLAKLGTAGVNYSIYPVDKDGTMIKPADSNWTPPRAQSDSEYRDTNRLEVPYLGGESYYYDTASDTYTKDGKPVPDSMKAELDYARRIIGMSPVSVSGVWDYYVLSEGEKPEVIRQNNGTNKIEEVHGEEAQKLIQKVREEQEAAAREAAALEKLGEKKSGEATVDEETGELIVAEEEKEVEVKPVVPVQPVSKQEGMQSFSQVIRGKSRAKIMDAIKDKVSKDSTWADAPIKSPKQLTEYLAKKGVMMDMVPTDEAGLDAWIQENIICK